MKRVGPRHLLLLAGLLAASAAAQVDYPTRPIRMIVSASQGGNTDFLARLIGAKLSESLKQPVVIENKSSALGVLAAEATAAAPPDGHTLLVTWHTHTIGGAMNPKLGYHPVESFTPITQFTASGFMLVVHPSTPVRTLKDFLDWMKTSREPLNFGSAGNGSGGHLAGELLKVLIGAKAQHVPYKGTGPMMTDILAGRYDFVFAPLEGSPPSLVRAGRLRALAVTSPRRLAAWPDLPAMAEALPGFEVEGWYGLLAPAKLPRPIAMLIYEEVRKAITSPEVRERILADGAEPVANTPDEFRQFLLADLVKWSKLVKESGARIE
jgi:tripartite-type tricarboxylate transporter receptor subunit TctC